MTNYDLTYLLIISGLSSNRKIKIDLLVAFKIFQTFQLTILSGNFLIECFQHSYFSKWCQVSYILFVNIHFHVLPMFYYNLKKNFLGC